jgi:4-hydroxyphenylpyruvate dioxygenase-like putative hemolysin
MYRGEPTDIDMGVALSYSGPIQIELIVQHNDAPSLFRDFLAERPEGGLHHVAFLTESLEAAIAEGESLGTPLVQQWTDQLGGRYAYLERRSPAEPYVELLESTSTLLGFFEQVEKEARRWDGDEPHRLVG